uniref:Uncharacterized protein n=1 Tax=Chrysotila carterae TaxID=13221 RepID=A0A7S4ET17_CHRCT
MPDGVSTTSFGVSVGFSSTFSSTFPVASSIQIAVIQWSSAIPWPTSTVTLPSSTAITGRCFFNFASGLSPGEASEATPAFFSSSALKDIVAMNAAYFRPSEARRGRSERLAR